MTAAGGGPIGSGGERCGEGRPIGAAVSGAGAGRSGGGGAAGLSYHPGYRAGGGWDRRLRRKLKTQVRTMCGKPTPIRRGPALARAGGVH